MTLRHLYAALVGGLLASSLHADVLILEKPQLGAFLDAQLAVDAATPGDTLLFLRGDYGGFTVDKGLTLHAPQPGARIEGTIVVQAVPMGEAVRLIGLEVRGEGGAGLQDGEAALIVLNCAGSLLASNCSFIGGDGGVISSEEQITDGAAGVRALNVQSVALFDCEVEGGKGGSWPSTAICCAGGQGGPGLLADQAPVSLYSSTATGGGGGDGGQFGTEGAHGLRSNGPRVLASGSSFLGGRGGVVQDFLGFDGGDGGDGMSLAVGVQPLLIENEYVGGQGGQGALGTDGQPGVGLIQGGSTPAELALRHRGLSGSAQGVAAGGSLDLHLEGRPGDRFYLAFSRAHQVRQLDRPAGTWIVPTPQLVLQQPIATLPATGEIDVQAVAPALPPGQQHAAWIVQALVRTANGKLRIGGALFFTTLEPAGLPDCNNNNSWDLLDITRGASDVEGDGLLDNCGPQTLFVDAAAAPGGDGSQGAPFSALGEAWALIGEGGSVQVAPGTYQGAGNQLLDLAGRSITLERDGAFGEVDLRPGVGILVLDTGALPGQLTLRNVSVRQGSTTTILLPDSRCVFDNCRFVGNTPSGSAVSIGPGSTVRDCFFAGNQSTGSFVRGSALRAAVPFRLIRSTFDNNGSVGVASSGGAVYVDRGSLTSPGDGDIFISQCIFRANTTTSRGGALRLVPFDGDTFVEGCFFALNQVANGSGIGGGAISYQSGGSFEVSGCTFAGNEAQGTARGGAISIVGGIGPASIVNSILWDNQAVQGAQLHVTFGSVDLAYSDLQGGAAGIGLNGATADIGPGFLDADPMFVQPSVGDYRLMSGSPCVDAGDLTALARDRFDLDGDGDSQEPTPLDLLGNPRFVDDPLTPDSGNGTPALDMGSLETQP